MRFPPMEGNLWPSVEKQRSKLGQIDEACAVQTD